MNAYMIDDKVSYIGEKFRGDLGGKMGMICSVVRNNPNSFVVDFGGDSYVLSVSLLKPFQGHLRGSEEDKKSKEPRVEQRRKGGRRTEESDTE